MPVQHDGPSTPYEVYCQRCHVTFAAETKRCIHCGGRLGRERFRPSLALPPGAEEIVFDEGGGKRSGFSPFTLVWVALLLAGYLYRSCTT